MYKEDLALKNRQCLISHKTPPNQINLLTHKTTSRRKLNTFWYHCFFLSCLPYKMISFIHMLWLYIYFTQPLRSDQNITEDQFQS